VSQLANNLILRADDGTGEFGLANPINIVSLPQLTLADSGSSLLLYWPVSTPTFVLETSSSLSPADWKPVAGTPLQIGNQYLMSLPVTTTNSFYRLRYSGP
jgi:hypothetical protein